MLTMHELMARLSNVRGTERRFTARCPAHDDHENSLSVCEGDRGILLKCFAGDSVEAICDALGIAVGDLFYERKGDAASDSVQYPYVDEQGVLLYEVVRQWPKRFLQRRPLASGGYAYHLAGVRPVLYRLPEVLEAVKEQIPILLCEGEKDVETLRPYEGAAGFLATAHSCGAEGWRKEYGEQLAGARVFLAPDHDDGGRRLLERAGAGLLGCARETRVLEFPAVAGKKGSDVTDWMESLLEEERIGALRSAIGSAPLYAQNLAEEPCLDNPCTSISDYLKEGFWGEFERSGGRLAVSTGFSFLDAQLGGGIFPGLYLLGAPSSMGKTAFLAQMADCIAGQGQDVLFFSLEMPRFEMVCRSLVREQYLKAAVSGGRAYCLAEVMGGALSRETLAEALARYERAARHLFLLAPEESPGYGAIESAVKAQLARTGRRPLVVVDYLQALDAPLPGMAPRQAVDANAAALKRMSRALAVPVFCASSFNRAGYAREAEFEAFKESGGLEFTADFVMALQARGIQTQNGGERERAQNAALAREQKERAERELFAVVLKNRRGPAQARAGLIYYAPYQLFVEREGGFSRS